MHVNFDQDGTMNHWGPSGWDLFLEPYGDAAKNIPRHSDQRSFNLKLDRTPEECAIIDEIFNAPDFYRNLKPIEGAIEAFRKTIERGHTVNIVTSPWWSNPNCLQDKSDWVAEHLGEDARKLIIFTDDKTSVKGDWLVDDKPAISGKFEREWEQIVFDQPYNMETSHTWRLPSWEDWGAYLDMFDHITVERRYSARGRVA